MLSEICNFIAANMLLELLLRPVLEYFIIGASALVISHFLYLFPIVFS